jgi:Ca-activated chloride channel family protein
MLEDAAFDRDDTDAGEMGAGHSMIAFYEIIPRREGQELSQDLLFQTVQTTGSDELFVVHLRYNHPQTGEAVRPASVVVPGLTDAPPSETFNFASAVVEWAMILADSEHRANANLDNIVARARANRGDDLFGHRAEFIQLVNLSRLLYED